MWSLTDEVPLVVVQHVAFRLSDERPAGLWALRLLEGDFGLLPLIVLAHVALQLALAAQGRGREERHGCQEEEGLHVFQNSLWSNEK